MNDQGASMFELLIVMSIMGLVLAAGMPSLRDA
ncbi:MAG: prepilin-type N-terminal cleavage/methylation domain-containing protein, partial [Nitrospirales bacterium]